MTLETMMEEIAGLTLAATSAPVYVETKTYDLHVLGVRYVSGRVLIEVEELQPAEKNDVQDKS